jgi:hypothetical protein
MAHHLGGPGKGKTNNPNGRKKGVPNRTTTEAREMLEKILYGQLENIELALTELKEKDNSKYLESCSRLFTYVLPKKTDLTTGGEKINITFTRNGSEN